MNDEAAALLAKLITYRGQTIKEYARDSARLRMALRALAAELREKPWHQRPSQVAERIERLIESRTGGHGDDP